MVWVRRLIWEPERNVTHIWDRHRLMPEDVESVCHGEHIVMEGYAGRLRVIGRIPDGRMLTVILAPEPERGDGVYYPVTARPAARKERARYREMMGSNDE